MEGWEVCEGVDRVFEGVEECLMAKRVGRGGGEGMGRFQGSCVECRVEVGSGEGGGGSGEGSGRAQSWALQRGVANFLEKKKELSGRRPSESKTSEISPHTISYPTQPKPKFLTTKKPNPIHPQNPLPQPSTLLKTPPLLPLPPKTSSRTNYSNLTFKTSATDLPPDPPQTDLPTLSLLTGLTIQPIHSNSHNTFYNTKR